MKEAELGSTAAVGRTPLRPTCRWRHRTRSIGGLNEILRAGDFDAFVERTCQKFYAARMGRPSLAPGVYFRLLLLGYFEGLDSERGIAWRAADSLALEDASGASCDANIARL
jgi:hypothetical protein